ncbi:hypothetical protein HDZ31DRAFT_85273 [Schizophyllum fasciatum]
MARSPPGRVLVTADKVDERLRAMSDQFAESLRGLGTRRRPVPARSGGTSAGGSGPGSSTTSRLVDKGGAETRYECIHPPEIRSQWRGGGT